MRFVWQKVLLKSIMYQKSYALYLFIAYKWKQLHKRPPQISAYLQIRAHPKAKKIKWASRCLFEALQYAYTLVQEINRRMVFIGYVFKKC